ncbi:MAG: 3-phosphoserine/phosphohydroxythreonine transaminase [Gammaproteobacteria bacterium]|nr:MAG: 3-phosphoserine/phosphohydroxythreonine transaminase [Gammaproteobacteria bacterium]
MARVFNFSPGPAVLPEVVLSRAKEELLDWHGSGISVMEMSHRGKEFTSIAQQAEADLRSLMAIPDNYKVLFMQGGASMNFSMAPLNLLGDKNGADYIHTGHWSKKAIAEGKRFCNVNVAASTEGKGYTSIPEYSEWQLSKDAAYVHYTPNETIAGVEFHSIPDTATVPLVADMSSTILSRPIDVSRYGVIYAGAQKNIGPAGLTIAIIRDDLLGNAKDTTPKMMDYQTYADNQSMYNTPPTFSWYMAGLVFQWIQGKGGLTAMAEINQHKSDKLYRFIDQSGGFYVNKVDKKCRSWMNIPFQLHDDALDKEFLQLAADAGLVQLKGHRSVGGMRASIYNAMPESGIDALTDFMQQFKTKKG